jgi:hypothetical protein
MKKLVSIETVVAEKEAELNTLKSALSAAKSMGYDLKIVSKGTSVIVPAKKATFIPSQDNRGKYLRPGSYKKQDFMEIREEMVKLAGSNPSIVTKDVWKHLRKSTRFTAIKKAQIYWQFVVLLQEGKLEKIEEGRFALPKVG